MARRPVDASISGTLVTEDPTALSLPDRGEDDIEDELDEALPDEDTLDEYDPPALLELPEPLGRPERPPMANTVAVDIAKVVTVASAVAANLNTVTLGSSFQNFYQMAHRHPRRNRSLATQYLVNHLSDISALAPTKKHLFATF